MEKAFLWSLTGMVWWMSAHTMTLLLPVAGPFLPASAAIPVGIMMGLIAWIAASRRLAIWLLTWAGLVSGSYLGWVFSRGEIRGSEFLPATGTDQVVGTLLCGLLGVVANGGMLWMMQHFSTHPIRLLSGLLLLLAIMLAAVTTVTLVGPSSS